MKRKPLAILGSAVLLALAVQGEALAAKYTERFERTFSVSPGVEVRVENTNGSIEIEAWDGSEVVLVAEKRANASSRDDAEEMFEKLRIEIEESSRVLEIKTEKKSSSGGGILAWIFGQVNKASVHYELKVPRDASLDIATVNGNVKTRDNGGEQTLRSVNGRIDVDGAGQDVDAHTTNGAIAVEIETAVPSLDVHLGSTNGGITLAIPESLAAELDASTVNGSVRSELELTYRSSSSRRKLEGEFNGGGSGQIGLRTINGSIRIEVAN